jgi:glyoxylate reductase
VARVVVQARLPGDYRGILAGHELIAPEATDFLVGEPLRAALAEADALLCVLTLKVDDALLAAAPRLRIVANCAVGYDNVDVPACTRRGVLVTNTPGVLTAATADLTLALILGAARRMREAMQLVEAGRWDGFRPDQLIGMDLDGATLGVIGLGRIGRAVADRARGFGMRVLYAQPRATDYPGEHVPLDELLRSSDVVTVHCPLRPETRHLIGARELGLMKREAVLVNTARGPIVDERALIDALGRGHLLGVGLDVFEDEPRVPKELVDCARVICLPHIGSAARATRVKMTETAARSIVDRLAGRRPAHPVNPDVLTS